MDTNTVVLTLPQKSPNKAIIRNNENVIDLFNRTIIWNKEWVRAGHQQGTYNNVSVTLSIKDNEWKDVSELMWKNRDNYIGMSLFPYDNKHYQQAPFEECTKKEFEELDKKVKKIDLSSILELKDTTELRNELACTGDSCEFK